MLVVVGDGFRGVGVEVQPPPPLFHWFHWQRDKVELGGKVTNCGFNK